MPPKKPSGPLSQVIPVLTGPIVCDVAAREPTTGKWSLIGIFQNVWASKFPTTRPMTVYIRLADGEGRYDINVKFVRTEDGAQIAEAGLGAEIASRLDSADIAVPFPPLEFSGPGMYEFQVWVNSSFLGAITVGARRLNG